MIEVYKIIHGKYDETCSLELELYQSVHATRTNSLNWQTPDVIMTWENIF